MGAEHAETVCVQSCGPRGAQDAAQDGETESECGCVHRPCAAHSRHVLHRSLHLGRRVWRRPRAGQRAEPQGGGKRPRRERQPRLPGAALREAARGAVGSPRADQRRGQQREHGRGKLRQVRPRGCAVALCERADAHERILQAGLGEGHPGAHSSLASQPLLASQLARVLLRRTPWSRLGRSPGGEHGSLLVVVLVVHGHAPPRLAPAVARRHLRHVHALLVRLFKERPLGRVVGVHLHLREHPLPAGCERQDGGEQVGEGKGGLLRREDAQGCDGGSFGGRVGALEARLTQKGEGERVRTLGEQPGHKARLPLLQCGGEGGPEPAAALGALRRAPARLTGLSAGELQELGHRLLRRHAGAGERTQGARGCVAVATHKLATLQLVQASLLLLERQPAKHSLPQRTAHVAIRTEQRALSGARGGDCDGAVGAELQESEQLRRCLQRARSFHPAQLVAQQGLGELHAHGRLLRAHLRDCGGPEEHARRSQHCRPELVRLRPASAARLHGRRAREQEEGAVPLPAQGRLGERAAGDQLQRRQDLRRERLFLACGGQQAEVGSTQGLLLFQARVCEHQHLRGQARRILQPARERFQGSQAHILVHVRLIVAGDEGGNLIPSEAAPLAPPRERPQGAQQASTRRGLLQPPLRAAVEQRLDSLKGGNGARATPPRQRDQSLGAGRARRLTRAADQREERRQQVPHERVQRQPQRGEHQGRRLRGSVGVPLQRALQRWEQVRRELVAAGAGQEVDAGEVSSRGRGRGAQHRLRVQLQRCPCAGVAQCLTGGRGGAEVGEVAAQHTELGRRSRRARLEQGQIRGSETRRATQ